MPEITELERGEYIQGWLALMQNQGLLINADTTVLYTLLFGYLLVAYFVGKSLTRAQSMILTALYTVAFLITLGGITLNGVANLGMYAEMMSICPECEQNPMISIPVIILIVVVNLAMLTASLYFIWSVRHPKTE